MHPSSLGRSSRRSPTPTRGLLSSAGGSRTTTSGISTALPTTVPPSVAEWLTRTDAKQTMRWVDASGRRSNAEAARADRIVRDRSALLPFFADVDAFGLALQRYAVDVRENKVRQLRAAADPETRGAGGGGDGPRRPGDFYTELLRFPDFGAALGGPPPAS